MCAISGMRRTWTISGDGGTPRTGSHFVRMIHIVNDFAHDAGQKPVFDLPEFLRFGDVYCEVYPRATITMVVDPDEDLDDNDRQIKGKTFCVAEDDVELQGWLIAARNEVR